MKHIAMGVALSAIAFGAALAGFRAVRGAAPSLPAFKDLKPWDPTYKAPKTAFGQPDLQGVWSTASLTTLTRNAQNGTGGMDLVIPQAKIDQLTFNSYYNVRLRNDNERTPETAAAGDGKGGGDVKGYNNFWIDPGSEYAQGEWRVSLVVDYVAGQRADPVQSRGHERGGFAHGIGAIDGEHGAGDPHAGRSLPRVVRQPGRAADHQCDVQQSRPDRADAGPCDAADRDEP